MRDNFLKQTNQFDVFQYLSREGFGPDEIKAFITHIFEPYIEDKEMLRKCAVGYLSNEANNLARIRTKPEWVALFELVLSKYKESKLSAPDYTYSSLAFWDGKIREAQIKYTAQVIFEVSKDGLSIEDFAYECFRNIGSVVSGYRFSDVR